MLINKLTAKFGTIVKKAAADREVWIIGLLAFLIFFPASWWGLPYATQATGTHSWEIDAVTGMQTLSELHNLFIDPKPDWYLAYPPFHYLLIGAVYTPYLGFLYLAGQFSAPTPEYPFGFSDPVTVIRNLTIIGRSLSLVMACGIIVNAYLIARTVWDRPTARLTALGAALPTTMLFYARTGNLEVPVLFWMSLTILLVARSFVSGFSLSRAVWLGVLAGVSVATKDSAWASLSVGLILLCAVHFWKGTPNTESVEGWKAPLILIATGLIVFFVGSGFLFSPFRFFAHISYVRNFEANFYLVIHLQPLREQTLQGYLQLFYDSFRELFIAIGPILLGSSLVGLVLAWRSSVFVRVLAAMLFGHIFLVIFPVRHMQYRYIMVPAYLTAFLAAWCFTHFLKSENRVVAKGILVLMILGYGWLGLRAVDLTYQMLYDARYEAGKWIKENVEDRKLAYFTVPNILPHIEKEARIVQFVGDPDPITRMKKENVNYVLIQPDWSSDIGAETSHFFPDGVYEKVKDGSLGYKAVASFETAPLLRGFLLDLPLVTPGYIVNTPIKIYEKEKIDENPVQTQ